MKGDDGWESCSFVFMPGRRTPIKVKGVIKKRTASFPRKDMPKLQKPTMT